MSSIKEEFPHLFEDEEAAAPPPEQPRVRQQQQQQQKGVPLAVELDEETAAAVQELRREQVQVRDLMTDLAGMLSSQQDGLDHVEETTFDAAERAKDGVEQLAEAERRRAGNHKSKAWGIGSIVGAALGLPLGPIGVAGGAALGGGVGFFSGRAVTNKARSNIDAEVDDFKRSHHLHQPGRVTEMRYELEEYTDKGGWAHVRWATPAGATSYEPDDEERIAGYEWLGKWRVDLQDRQSDMHGWQYAKKWPKAGHVGTWDASIQGKSKVRRRRWFRVRRRSDAPPPAPIDADLLADVRIEIDDADEEERLRSAPGLVIETDADGRHFAVVADPLDPQISAETLAAAQASLEALEDGREQIDRTSAYVAAEDSAAERAKRIHRAGTLSGILRNLFSCRSDLDADHLAAKRRRAVDKEAAKTSSGRVEPEIEASGTSASQTLEMSRAISSELHRQNVALDHLGRDMDRASRKTSTINAKIAKEL